MIKFDKGGPKDESHILEDVRGKGKKAKSKELRPKLLIKNGKAKQATTSAISTLKGQQHAEAKNAAAELAEAKVLKTKIEDDATIVEIKSKAGEDSRLFGSIPSKQIAQALEQQYKIKVDKRKIDLQNPSKHWDIGVWLFDSSGWSVIRVHIINE